MKTYEPLPLLDCIKELTSSHPPSPQKSLDMNDEELDQDGTSLLDEFKLNSPTINKTFMSDIQIKTIESEYNQVGINRNCPTHTQNGTGASNANDRPTITNSLNPCAKTPNHNAIISNLNSNNCFSDNNLKSSKPLGIESLPNIILPLKSSIESHCCHRNPESQSGDNIDKDRSNIRLEANERYVDKTHVRNVSGHTVNGCENETSSSASLNNIETLSSYVRTNEFINEILKSPVRPEPCVISYEDQALGCGISEFKDINLNSPLKPSPEEVEQSQMPDSHLVHLRTLDEIDEDEALCLCSNSVSSTLSSTTKRVPCISDSADIDSGAESASSSWERTVAEVKGAAISRLQEELRSAHEELKLKDEEVARLSRLRQEVESELEELTASLFQEAHNMVREANMRHATSEKLLRESKLQVDVLSAEVSALKTLVLTSTPSRPNPHLHPQIETKNSSSNRDETQGSSGCPGSIGIFRKHRRSPSHCHLKYGREDSPPSESGEDPDSNNLPVNSDAVYTKDCKEVDPVVHKEFLEWRSSPVMSKDSPFISRIYSEDIEKSLAFSNTELAERVREAIDSGDISIEAVSDKTKSSSFPRKCALLEVPRLCLYRMKLDAESDTWYYISKLCRNRIIKVCDILNYLQYIQRGLVKSSAHDVYWEINRLRKEIVLARLGLTKDED